MSLTSTLPRTDRWTSAQDARLAQIVLTHIRNGSTQLRAFTVAGQEMDRTAGACGFRWNGVLRKRYAKQIKDAKLERRRPKGVGGEVPFMMSGEAVQHVLAFIAQFDLTFQRLQIRHQQLLREVSELQHRLQYPDSQSKNMLSAAASVTVDSKKLTDTMEQVFRSLQSEKTLIGDMKSSGVVSLTHD